MVGAYSKKKDQKINNMIFESLFISQFSRSSNFPISTRETENSWQISLSLSTLWPRELCKMELAMQTSSTGTANLKLSSFLRRVIISFALLWATFLSIAFTFRFGRICVYSLLFQVSLLCSISKKKENYYIVILCTLSSQGILVEIYNF